MFSLRSAVIALAKDAAYTFGSAHCPPNDSTHDVFAMMAKNGNDGGFESLNAQDYMGLSWMVALIVIPILAAVALLIKGINGDQFVAILLATLAFVAGKTSGK